MATLCVCAHEPDVDGALFIHSLVHCMLDLYPVMILRSVTFALVKILQCFRERNPWNGDFRAKAGVRTMNSGAM